MAEDNTDEGSTRFLPEAFKKRRNQRKAAPPPPPPPVEDDASDLPFEEDETPVDDGFEQFDEPAPAPAPAPRQRREDPPARDPRDDKIDRLLDALERMQRDNARLAQELADAKKAKTEAEPRKPRIELPTVDATIDEDKLNADFPTLLPTVRAIARREVQSYVQAVMPQLERQFDEADRAVATAKETATKSAEAMFRRDVTAAIPDLRTLNNDQRFQDYLEQQAPMHARGVTLRSLMSHAWQNQDVDTLVEVVAAFKAKNPAQPQPRKPAANAEQFVQPSSQSRSTPVRDPNAAGKLKQSDWNKARQQLMRGELTAAAYAPIKAKFERAKAEGRLVDDTAAAA